MPSELTELACSNHEIIFKPTVPARGQPCYRTLPAYRMLPASSWCLLASSALSQSCPCPASPANESALRALPLCADVQVELGSFGPQSLRSLWSGGCCQRASTVVALSTVASLYHSRAHCRRYLIELVWFPGAAGKSQATTPTCCAKAFVGRYIRSVGTLSACECKGLSGWTV